MIAPIRVLVLFPSGTESDSVQAGLASVKHVVSKPIEVTDSFAWHQSRFSACGSWDSWALEAATGRSYRDRQPYFHAFVLIGDDVVGQATAKIVDHALKVGKKVYHLADTTLSPVNAVVQAGGTWRIRKGG